MNTYVNVDAYLKRIDYDGPLGPTPETLRRLQLAHLLAVPFENLSIHAYEPIVLNDEALFDKIVTRRRGGFCYELNGLFAALLRSLGYEVEMLSAQVYGPDEFGPDFDHMTLRVTAGEPWLVDVGFGDSFIEPLRLNERGEQLQNGQAYRIAPDGEHLIVQLRDDGQADSWKPQYRFTLRPYQYADYAEMCEFHQTSPNSHFTRKRICSRLTPEGRITLSDMRLITTNAGERREREVANQQEYAEILRREFGIVM